MILIIYLLISSNKHNEHNNNNEIIVQFHYKKQALFAIVVVAVPHTLYIEYETFTCYLPTYIESHHAALSRSRMNQQTFSSPKISFDSWVICTSSPSIFLFVVFVYVCSRTNRSLCDE